MRVGAFILHATPYPVTLRPITGEDLIFIFSGSSSDSCIPPAAGALHPFTAHSLPIFIPQLPTAHCSSLMPTSFIPFTPPTDYYCVTSSSSLTLSSAIPAAVGSTFFSIQEAGFYMASGGVSEWHAPTLPILPTSFLATAACTRVHDDHPCEQ